MQVKQRHSLSLFLQVCGKLLHGTRTVRDGVLNLLTKFGKALVIAVRNEDWIIAETLSAMLLSGNMSTYLAFELNLMVFAISPFLY